MNSKFLRMLGVAIAVVCAVITFHTVSAQAPAAAPAATAPVAAAAGVKPAVTSARELRETGIVSVVKDAIGKVTELKSYPGSGIEGWNLSLKVVTELLTGEYAYNNPKTTGGAQGLFRDNRGKILHVANNRDVEPYIQVRESDDDGLSFTQPWGLAGCPPFNGIAIMQMGARIRIVGGLNHQVGDPITRWVESEDYLKTISKQGSYHIGSGITLPPVTLKSGTLLIPFHYEDVRLYAKVGIIRHDNSKTTPGDVWQIIKGTEFPGGSIAEPAIIEANNGLVMLISRHESQGAVGIVSPWVSSFVWDDGIKIDPMTQELTSVETPTRLSGNPPFLLKLPGGRILLIFSPGGGEKFHRIWQTLDCKKWSLLGTAYTDEAGANDSYRYLAALLRKDGESILVTSSEPDQAPTTNPGNQYIFRIPPFKVVEFTSGAKARAISASPTKKTYFDIYLTVKEAVAGPASSILFGTSQNTLGGWNIGGAGANPGLATIADTVFIGRGMFNNKEKLLRMVYDPTTQKLDFYENDEHRGQSNVYPGWPGGIPDIMSVNISAGGSKWWIRDQEIYTK